MKKGNWNNTKVEAWETVMWNSVFWTELDNCILELIAPVVKCRIFDTPAVKVYSKFICKKKKFSETIHDTRDEAKEISSVLTHTKGNGEEMVEQFSEFCEGSF